MRIVVPFDGSPAAQHATEYVIRLARECEGRDIEVHLLNVQQPIAGFAESFGRDAADVASRLAGSARESGARLLTGPTGLLEAADVRVLSSVLIGDPAQVIAAYTDKNHCDEVVMGTRGMGAVGGLILGSVASKVIHLVDVPVTLVNTGPADTRLPESADSRQDNATDRLV